MTAAPDASQIETQRLADVPFPGRAKGLRVYFDKAAHDAVHAHALHDTSVEICGVLVGDWRKDQIGPYVHISAAIRGEAAASKNTEVTFTHQTWEKINQTMDRDYADRVIVGWYHTHPDFGIFLSDRDMFIHQHFFSAPGQVAMVVDPIRREEGVFVWEDGKAALSPSHWVGDGQVWSPRKGSTPAPAVAADDNGPSLARIRPAAPQPFTPSAGSLLLYVAAAAGLVAAGYYAAGYNQQHQRLLTAQALAEQLYNKTSRPDTRESLIAVRSLLNEVGDESRKLTEPKKEGAEPVKPEQISAAIGKRLAAATAEVNRAIELQSLTAEQQAAVDWFVSQRLQVAVDQAVKELVAKGLLKPVETEKPNKGDK